MAGDGDMPNGKMEPDWKTGADGEAEIQCCVGFGAGIAKDFRRRRPLYGDDWSRGTGVGLKIFAPATYIFFASVLPALTFGEQFREETQELFSIPHILCATAIAGLAQPRPIPSPQALPLPAVAGLLSGPAVQTGDARHGGAAAVGHETHARAAAERLPLE